MLASCRDLHHCLELLHLFATCAAGRVLVVRGEEADGVVSPVVAEPPFAEVRVLHELVHRQELDRGDPELLEVVDRGGMGQAGVGASERLGHVGVGLVKPFTCVS